MMDESMKDKNNIMYEVWSRGFQEDPMFHGEYIKSDAIKLKKKLERENILIEVILHKSPEK